MLNWIVLNKEEQLEQLKTRSFQRPQVIFKHSTRCSISQIAKSRLENARTIPDGMDFYYLDLLSNRTLSGAIAETYQVYHESPQVLLIKNGDCIYDESHTGISMDELTGAAVNA
jgi:bacillithiol system protein YtxJ